MIIRNWFTKRIRATLFHSLNKLQEVIFIIYLKRDYPAYREVYEKKLHEARAAVMQAMQRARRWLAEDELEMFEQLIEILSSLNQLKSRINNHDSFEIGEQEFRLLLASLKQIFLALAIGKSFDLVNLQTAILGFEEVSQSALQVITIDPLVLILFLRDLQALHRCLMVTLGVNCICL